MGCLPVKILRKGNVIEDLFDDGGSVFQEEKHSIKQDEHLKRKCRRAACYTDHAVGKNTSGSCGKFAEFRKQLCLLGQESVENRILGQKLVPTARFHNLAFYPGTRCLTYFNRLIGHQAQKSENRNAHNHNQDQQRKKGGEGTTISGSSTYPSLTGHRHRRKYRCQQQSDQETPDHEQEQKGDDDHQDEQESTLGTVHYCRHVAG